MIKSNYDSIDDFFNVHLLNKEFKQSKNNLAFIILDNNDIPWTWLKEKMAQSLLWNLQGGVTGAGSGHHLFFYKNLDLGLKEVKEKGYTHAMVCKIGMLISGFANQVTTKTPVQNFYEFSESDEFMRAHILAHPNQPASIHLQHFEINLVKWNDKPFVKLGNSYKRSKENIHDDYTPLWIDTLEHPRINNFTKEQRQEKIFLYPHRDYEENEKIYYDYIKHGIEKINSNPYSSSNLLINHSKKKRKRFYYENNEPLPTINEKYDVIIVPSSGILAEYLYETIGHENTKVIIFDYEKTFLDIKQTIINNGFVGQDLLMYMKHLSNTHDKNEWVFSTGRTPNQFAAFESNKNITNESNALRLLNNLSEANYEMKVVNMLSDNFNWIPELVNNKSVFCYLSNIFQYYVTWIYYEASEIKYQYELLEEKLATAKQYALYGRTWQ